MGRLMQFLEVLNKTVKVRRIYGRFGQANGWGENIERRRRLFEGYGFAIEGEKVSIEMVDVRMPGLFPYGIKEISAEEALTLLLKDIG